MPHLLPFVGSRPLASRTSALGSALGIAALVIILVSAGLPAAPSDARATSAQTTTGSGDHFTLISPGDPADPRRVAFTWVPSPDATDYHLRRITGPADTAESTALPVVPTPAGALATFDDDIPTGSDGACYQPLRRARESSTLALRSSAPCSAPRPARR
jgi:hypothetical protein